MLSACKCPQAGPTPRSAPPSMASTPWCTKALVRPRGALFSFRAASASIAGTWGCRAHERFHDQSSAPEKLPRWPLGGNTLPPYDNPVNAPTASLTRPISYPAPYLWASCLHTLVLLKNTGPHALQVIGAQVGWPEFPSDALLPVRALSSRVCPLPGKHCPANSTIGFRGAPPHHA